jgi:hypothetical protein
MTIEDATKHVGLRQAFPNDEAREAMMSASREEMYRALELFHTHVKHTLSLMFTLLTAVFAVLGFVLQEAQQEINSELVGLFKLAGGFVLILVFPLGLVSIFIIGRYYKLYVAALLYATELHEEEGLASHQWFRDSAQYRSTIADASRAAVSNSELIRRRTYGWPHSWILYSLLIGLIALTALAVGITMLLSL